MAWARREPDDEAEAVVVPIRPRRKIWVLVDAENWATLTSAARDLVRERPPPA